VPAGRRRPELCPLTLHVAEEDVDANVADPLELLEQLALGPWLAPRLLAQPPEITARGVEQARRSVADMLDVRSSYRA